MRFVSGMLNVNKLVMNESNFARQGRGKGLFRKHLRVLAYILC